MSEGRGCITGCGCGMVNRLDWQVLTGVYIAHLFPFSFCALFRGLLMYKRFVSTSFRLHVL